MHLAGEQLKLVTGIQMLHVAYKGSGGAYVDVMDGRVDLLIDPLFASLPHVAGGKLKPIAVMSNTRDAVAPNVPAAGETLPDFDVRSINGLVAPKSTPRPLLERISADVAAVLQGDALKAHLKELGLEPVGSTPDSFDSYVRKEVAKWAKVVNAANVSID
jgi:tripartite-type tricarboxylate transporter receptor subunit TctC